LELNRRYAFRIEIEIGLAIAGDFETEVKVGYDPRPEGTPLASPG